MFLRFLTLIVKPNYDLTFDPKGRLHSNELATMVMRGAAAIVLINSFLLFSSKGYVCLCEVSVSQIFSSISLLVLA